MHAADPSLLAPAFFSRSADVMQLFFDLLSPQTALALSVALLPHVAIAPDFAILLAEQLAYVQSHASVLVFAAPLFHPTDNEYVKTLGNLRITYLLLLALSRNQGFRLSDCRSR